MNFAFIVHNKDDDYFDAVVKNIMYLTWYMIENKKGTLNIRTKRINL